MIRNDMTKSTNTLFNSISKLAISTKINPEVKEKQSHNVTPTMETSFLESNLQFKKRQPKRKLNKVTVKKAEKEKIKGLWNAPIISTGLER